jgi:hypothetical protein
MPRCCGGSTCACSIIPGVHTSIEGSGTASDPFVITGDVGVAGVAGSVFTVTITGTGTIADPWDFAVAFSSTAKLDDLPDVNAPAPTNNQVLGWDSATSKWTPRAPTAASPGAVNTDTSLSGDGSAGDPLEVAHNSDGYTETTATGIGISLAGKNRMVLHYANDSVRALSTIVPETNSLSVLDDTPGVTWYWTGTQWKIVDNATRRDYGTSQLLAMSGPYAGGVTTVMVRRVSLVTNADGTFDVLTSTDLSGAAGVLSCVFQETGTVPFKAMLTPNINSIQGTAYRLDDGTPYGSQAVEGVAVAYLY